MAELSRSSIAHVARAVHQITGRNQLVLVGSAALIAAYGEDKLPSGMLQTGDVDIFALDAPDDEKFSDQVGQIGISSSFEQEYNYFPDGVSRYTAMMPDDWQDRATRRLLDEITLFVPDPNDIAISKICAWRERDRHWVDEALEFELIDIKVIAKRITGEIVRRPDGREPPPPVEERLRRVRYIGGKDIV